MSPPRAPVDRPPGHPREQALTIAAADSRQGRVALVVDRVDDAHVELAIDADRDIDLDKIQKSLKAGELGYWPDELALRYDRPLSEGIHFVLSHEYVHHKRPGSPHGELFNRRAKAIRDATPECN